MKIVMSVVACLFSFFLFTQNSVKPASRTTGGETPEEILLQMENKWAQVDITGDMSVLERELAPDIVSVTIRGTDVDLVESRKEFISHYELEGVTSAVNSDLKVHLYGSDVAVVIGIDNTKGKDKAGKSFSHKDRFTDTWLKRDGKWQCIAAHVTRIE